MNRAEFRLCEAAVCACLAALYPCSNVDAATCVNADPLGIVTNINADFELTVDPRDPNGSLLYTSNTGSGAADIVVGKIDGQSGNLVALSTVATNYYGKSIVGGPEWYQKPTGELGLLYAGVGGLHAIFRSASLGPGGWNQFIYDVNGAPVQNGQAPVLANTTDGAYPALNPPPRHAMYGQFLGACQSQCYGNIDSTAATDVSVSLAAAGLTYSVADFNANRDGYLFIGACDALQKCGIYEAAIDNAGGFAAGTLKKLYPANISIQHLTSGRHPVTGDTVLFTLGLLNGKDTINVWKQPAAGGALTPVAQVAVNPSTRHYQAESDNTQLVLIYEIDQGTAQTNGTYTLPVTANGSTLVVGTPKRVSTVGSGQEVVWFPATDQWALYYNDKTTAGPTSLMRCPIVP